MNQKEEELYELPKWVKLVSSVLNVSKRSKDGERDFNRGSGAEEA